MLSIDEKKGLNSSKGSLSASTSNSTGRKCEEIFAEYELLRRKYAMLLKNYNELQEKNKSLMGDYAVLRSQLEDLKTVFVKIHY